jgi:hypothetical protein
MKETAKKQNFWIYRDAMTHETPSITHKNGDSHCITYDTAYSFILCHVHFSDRKCATAEVHRHNVLTPPLYCWNIYLMLFWIQNT